MQTDKINYTASPYIVKRLIGFITFTFAGYFTIGLALGVLPVFIHQQLGFSTMTAGVVISLQYVTTFLFRGYAGTVVDKKGPKPAVIMGMIGFALSGLLLFIACLLRNYHTLSLAMLILTRLMAGFGEGLIGASPINWAILSVGDKHTSKVISYNGVASYGALAVAAPIGLLLYHSWGIGSLGLLTAAVGMAGFFYAQPKPALKGNSKDPAESFMRVLKTVLPYGICLTLGGLGFGTISTFITLYYAYLNWNNAVLCLSVFSLLFVLGRIMFASSIDTYGGIKTAIVCLALESTGLLILWLAPVPQIALVGAGITGLGFSLLFPALGVEAVKLVPGSSKGAALGSYGLFLDLSLGVTGPLIGGVASHFGMLYIFPFSMIMVLIGFVMTLLILTARKSQFALH